MRDAAQYHCCFLLDRELATLNMAIAWRRVGSHDYGIYLTKRQGSEEFSPLCTIFKAVYSPRGEISGFLVKDGWVAVEKSWDEDHLRPGGQRIPIEPEDVAQVEVLAKAFFAQWLESFGEAEASSMLKKLGFAEADNTQAWRRVLSSGLPAAIQKARLPDVLSCAEATEHGCLYAFLPFPERPGGEGAATPLLEEKMRLFFELL